MVVGMVSPGNMVSCSISKAAICCCICNLGKNKRAAGNFYPPVPERPVRRKMKQQGAGFFPPYRRPSLIGNLVSIAQSCYKYKQLSKNENHPYLLNIVLYDLIKVALGSHKIPVNREPLSRFLICYFPPCVVA